MIFELISFIICLAWVYWMFRLGQKEKTLMLFYVLISLSVLLSTIMLPWTIMMNLYENIGAVVLWIVPIFLAERLIWAITLREASGKDELIWFYLIYAFPGIGWIIYRITKIR